MSVQVVANLVDESILTKLPFLPENLSPTAWRQTQNVFVPSGSYGQIWSLITGQSSTPPVFIYDITSSNGDLKFKGSIGSSSVDGGKYKGYGVYSQNLDKILVFSANNAFAFSSSIINAQPDGFTASLGSALEQSLISYSCSLKTNTGEGIIDNFLGYAWYPNMIQYTPSASIDYYTVCGPVTSSNGNALSPSLISSPLSTSIAILSSSGQNISGAANLYPVGFFMSTFDSNTPSNELYVDLTTPLTASFNVPLNKILTGTFVGNSISGFSYAETICSAYNPDLNRIYCVVKFTDSVGIVELNNNITPPTVISVITSSGAFSVYESEITYNTTNKDLILLNDYIATSSKFHIIDASTTLDSTKFTSPKEIILTTGANNVSSRLLAISNSYYSATTIRGASYPLVTPLSSSLYYLNKIQSSSIGYIVTSQSFAKSYESPSQASFFTFEIAHATSSNIDKIITADRSNVGPISDPNTIDENLVTTFARAGYIYAIDKNTLTTSSFFTPYTTQLNGVSASTAVTVSGSTEVGYKLNTRNLLLAYDAGSEDSFPPPPNNKIYDLSGNFNNATLPADVTYDSVSSSFFFTSSLSNSNIPFTASELSTATVITVEAVVKFTQNATYQIIYGFDRYSLLKNGSQLSFSTLNGDFYGYNINAATDTWYYFAAEMYPTSSAPITNNKLWVNGSQGTLTTSSSYNPLIAKLTFNNGIGTIGNDAVLNNDASNMNGYIPVFKIYKRALSQQEITENYNFYKSRYPIP